MCWQDKLRLNRYKRSLSIVRVMRGIRFAHSFPELGRSDDQGDSAIFQADGDRFSEHGNRCGNREISRHRQKRDQWHSTCARCHFHPM